MPRKHITYPNSKRPVLLYSFRGAVTTFRSTDVRIDEMYLSSFGKMRVPTHLWIAIQRIAAWIEPAILAEWKRETQKYAATQRRSLNEAKLSEAMMWSDPDRDVRIPRERAERLLAAGRLHCVWSGKRLSADILQIDHCLPWTAWPCGDLWNLMPTHRRINQEKRDRLPAERLMRAARDRILDWWDAAYRESAGRSLAERFALEASMSLPGMVAADGDLESYYSALSLQRLRLKQNQQVPEWSGNRYL